MSAPAAAAAAAAAPAQRLTAVSDKVDFNAEEDKVLKYWNDISAFETSLKQSEGKPIYTFYDGPPFATGLPHYGHILAGTIKDVVTRYAHQTGHHVVRRFGWDCHGLPVEYEIDTKLGIKTKEDVMKMGVAAYNNECRGIVQRYTKEWEATVKRMGRWIDFKNDYKTMDLSFMESVWWVFSQLHAKGLVYRGYKVMPYSTGCTTPLSNFEAGLNYKDVSDPAVVVNFPLVGVEPKTSLLAWTTTPWTLPSNLALAVNKEFTYVKLRDAKTGEQYIICKTRIGELYPPKKAAAAAAKPAAAAAAAPAADGKPAAAAAGDKKKAAADAPAAAPVAQKTDEYEILEEFKGDKLVGLRYEPVFPYFASYAESHTAFRVINASYVTDDSGTGIVHQAPAFGEDDYNACASEGIIKRGEEILCPVDGNGHFTKDVSDFKGRYVKEADKDIIANLKKRNRLVKQNQLVHSYPFCWRSETPLIYKAVPSWFVNVEKIKAQLLESNAQTYWVPEFVKEKRFHNWLTDARDWAVSRNRYWGTPLPIWMSEDAKEIVVISSIQQLEELSGVKGITDIHKDKVDHITIPSKRGKEFGVLKRVEEVFDCWFESGSMPYAQLHYPFENQEYFEKGFPADFIAEGLDQTRGWFYTLMVISTGLFGKPAFKNLIVNGLVLAADGKKMSKRLKNYPDPNLVVSKYGADALRLYLINSPVVRAEPLRFQEAGVHEVVKSVCLPWFHAYRFFVENTLRYEKENQTTFVPAVPTAASLAQANVMDAWILSAFQSLLKFVHQEMAAYRLYTVVPKLLEFIEQLTNWYVRMNRSRLKGKFGAADSAAALSTLFRVLLSLCKLMAPFTPFFVDFMYQNLRRALPVEQQSECVHYEMIPQADASQENPRVEERVKRMQKVIELGRLARDNAKITMRKPLRSALIVHNNAAYLEDVQALKQYVLDELNVRGLDTSSDVDKFILLKALPNRKALGGRFGKNSPAFAKAIGELTHAQLLPIPHGGSVTISGEVLTSAEIDVQMQFQGDRTKLMDAGDGDVLVILNIEEDAQLVQESLAREVTRRVQQLRKEAGLVPTDDCDVFFRPAKGVDAAQSNVCTAIVQQAAYVREVLGRDLYPADQFLPSYAEGAALLAQGTLELEGESSVQLYLTRMFVSVDEQAVAAAVTAAGLPAQAARTASLYLAFKDWATLNASASAADAKLVISLEGKRVEFNRGTHFFLSAKERAMAAKWGAVA